MNVEPKTKLEPWTIGRLLSWTKEYLTRNGVDEAKLASEVLLAHSIRCRRIDLYARFEDVPDAPCVDRFRERVRRAAAQEPIAYLVGEKEFFSLPFTVSSDVLIPRPETETLVEVVVDRCRQKGWDRPCLLDLGTGSGCISIAVLVQLEGATVIATDISSRALEMAQINAGRHNVSNRMTFFEADRLDLPSHVIPEGGFHLIVSNPPYVATDKLGELDATVRKYEPLEALSDGQDGLSFYRSMAVDSPKMLSPNGILIVEVADGQASKVQQTMEDSGNFTHRDTIKDRVCGMERVLVFSVCK